MICRPMCASVVGRACGRRPPLLPRPPTPGPRVAAPRGAWAADRVCLQRLLCFPRPNHGGTWPPALLPARLTVAAPGHPQLSQRLCPGTPVTPLEGPRWMPQIHSWRLLPAPLSPPPPRSSCRDGRRARGWERRRRDGGRHWSHLCGSHCLEVLVWPEGE